MDGDDSGGRRADDRHRAAVEGGALRRSERLLRSLTSSAEAGQHTRSTDLQMDEPVAVCGDIALVVSQRDRDIGEVVVVGANGVAVADCHEPDRVAGSEHGGPCLFLTGGVGHGE
jgi:hypothetical protein